MNCDTREIRAGFDQEGIFIFQAFRPAAAEWAVKNQKFGFGFSLKRFTWIKPSFGWMLYRSNFASKEGQEKILRIKIHHAAFLFILENSIPAIYDPVLFPDIKEWHSKMKTHGLRYQWDPERDLFLNKIIGVRSLQLGIGPPYIKSYAQDWVIEISDITEICKNLQKIKGNHRYLKNPFPESIYPLPLEVRYKLRCV